MQLFEEWESNVRSYCRTFPCVFSRAKGSYLYDENGKAYLDFFCGAGSLNYGHNNDFIKHRVADYLLGDNALHALDMHTSAKRDFIDAFVSRILKPRSLSYKIQFCGPTGTNAVEAALKIARRVTGRSNIIAFQGGFHGMSLGSLAVTANREYRMAAGLPLSGAVFAKFPTASDWQVSLDELEGLFGNSHSGVDLPAAIILETLQAEGGVNEAPLKWLQGVRTLCDQFNILMIVDDIQVGCFRTGSFFSFDNSGVVPDIVTLSKSISGLGLPMSLTLLKPELDIWKPGEHTGTFRGNQLAFVGATAALEFAASISIEDEVNKKAKYVGEFLRTECAKISKHIAVRGKGLIWGCDLTDVGGGQLAKLVSSECFHQGLIIERAGKGDAVLKIMPSLTIDHSDLQLGCEIIIKSVNGHVK